jgi:arginyl-tRNA--protein-N-Asp/Glu arginylyltransferase
VEVVVFDEPGPCPYIEGRTARTPLRFPRALSPAEFDRRLAEGDRRMGYLLYRTQCPGCQACEPIRLDVATFRPNESQRRTLRKGDARLRVVIGTPKCDDARVELFNRHQFERGLARDDKITHESYKVFLIDTCTRTVELALYADNTLVGVSVSDWGHDSLNAVYTYYDPTFKGLGLGTYSILKQVELCRERGLTKMYLGFYVAQNSHMAYKANYRPHERLVDGRWQVFDG